MIIRRYGIFKSYRRKRGCTYDEMYKWYIEHCEDNDTKHAMDKFYSAYWKAIDYTNTLNGTVTVGLREDCSSIVVLKHRELFFTPVEFKIEQIDEDSYRRNYIVNKSLRIDNAENLDGEVWKDIEGYEGLYQISNMGRVKRDYVLKTVLQRTGYLHIGLSKNGKYKGYRVHRLVAKAFLPNPNNYKVINHKNGNKQDNRVENLEWCTTSYNVWHALFVLNKGQNKLSMEDANKIRKDVLAGKYTSVKEIAQEYKCNRTIIENILSNACYKTNDSYPIELLRKKNILPKEVITKIRSEYSNGENSVPQLAKKFGLTRGLIANIVTNKSYKDTKYEYTPHETYKINNVYGTLKLLKKERVNTHTYFTCECVKCGNVYKYYDNIKLQERDCKFCKEYSLKKNNKSGYSSLYYHKRRKKWEVSVTINYKQYHLGAYKTQKEALEISNEFMHVNGLDSRIQEYRGELVIINDEQREVQEEWEKENIIQMK